MKVLIIGMNPSSRGGKSPTLKTLDLWAEALMLDKFSFTNLYDKPGSFSLKDIERDKIRSMAREYDRVIALGSKVSDVLNLMDIDHFKLPHPSGLNRQLNDKHYVSNALRECRMWLWSK